LLYSHLVTPFLLGLKSQYKQMLCTLHDCLFLSENL
ncbi:hypothetical protein D029_4818B, partial [Vibrio parahaemolyticus 970107]